MPSPPVSAIGLALAGVLLAIAALHVSWAVRGRLEGSAVIPEVEGRPAFVPTRAQTYAVASALALAATLVLLRSGWLAIPGLPPWVPKWGCAGLAGVLLLRALGDRRYVGFSKRIKGTRFARWDTRLFSPLCLVLGLAALWLV